MTRALITIRSDADREKAARWARGISPGSRIEFKPPQRSIDQNKLMWARLGDISRQLEWFGEMLTDDDWKDLLTAHFRKCRVVPGIDPGTVVPLGLHTSDMGKGEMNAFLECIAAFGAERGVKFGDEE